MPAAHSQGRLGVSSHLSPVPPRPGFQNISPSFPPNPRLLPAPQDLATPQAFARNPSQVWEFYHYRREVVQSKEPNAGHLAIAECQARLHRQGRQVVVITQNIDELHRKAGTRNLLEIHGERPLVFMGGETRPENTCAAGAQLGPPSQSSMVPGPQGLAHRLPGLEKPVCVPACSPLPGGPVVGTLCSQMVPTPPPPGRQEAGGLGH